MKFYILIRIKKMPDFSKKFPITIDKALKML